MPFLTTTFALFSFICFSTSAPTTIRRQSQSSTCAQYDPVTFGPYNVQNDIWGATSGAGQSQCSQITNFDGNNLAWSSKFSWSGNNSIKAYANAEASSITTCKPLNQFGGLKTQWQWRYGLSHYPAIHFSEGRADLRNSYPASASIVGDVSYDAFLAPVCNGPGDNHPYEIMVWLAALGGLNPIGAAGPSISIGSHSWVLWSGPNQQTGAMVFSFVATEQVNSFDGDLTDFFKYLVKNNGVDGGLLLTTIQAGTEVAVGSSTFITSMYNIRSA